MKKMLFIISYWLGSIAVAQPQCFQTNGRAGEIGNVNEPWVLTIRFPENYAPDVPYNDRYHVVLEKVQTGIKTYSDFDCEVQSKQCSGQDNPPFIMDKVLLNSAIKELRLTAPYGFSIEKFSEEPESFTVARQARSGGPSRSLQLKEVSEQECLKSFSKVVRRKGRGRNF